MSDYYIETSRTPQSVRPMLAPEQVKVFNALTPDDIKMIVDQPAPVHNDQVPIVDIVMDELAERKRIGIERYGVPLQPFNGRNSLVDKFQEDVDSLLYGRQFIEEMRVVATKLAHLRDVLHDSGCYHEHDLLVGIIDSTPALQVAS